MTPWHEQLEKIKAVKPAVSHALAEARQPITEAKLDAALFESEDPVKELTQMAHGRGLPVLEVLKKAEQRLAALEKDASNSIRTYEYNQQRTATRAANRVH